MEAPIPRPPHRLTLTVGQEGTASGAAQARRKFLRFFPGGFHDPRYLDWERSYKWAAHERWSETLGRVEHRALLHAGRHAEVAARAVKTESRTNLLFSFEKMALRDAVRDPAGAEAFAEGLYRFLYGGGDVGARFEEWVETVERLPRRQTRVLTWPLVTVFGFIAQPDTHFFLKPNVTRTAAREYGFALGYASRPSWAVYARLLAFAEAVRADLADLEPRDMIDLQSFVWVAGSNEYAE